MLERTERGLTTSEILSRTGWPAGEIQDATAKLVAAGRARVVASQPMTTASMLSVTECTATLGKIVEDFHRANPLLPGIPKQELLARMEKFGAAIVETALSDLVKARKAVLTGDMVQNAGREVVLTPEEARAKGLIEGEFESAGLAVPGFAAVLETLPVDAKRAEKLLQILLREKVLVKVTSDLIFHRSALIRLREMLARYKKERGELLPIAAFKDLTGVSRKYAIPLLEHLDREHVTRRSGDQRVII